jgi:glycosyltransferase involved in cell wall biosynthesis
MVADANPTAPEMLAPEMLAPEMLAPKILAPKILEIGATPYMWHAFPETTEFYSSWPDETVAVPADGRHIVSLAALPGLARRLADPTLDLVVAHAPASSPYGGRALVRALFRRSVLRGNIAAFRGFGTELLRGRIAAPLAVLDLDDSVGIARCNLFLLDKAALYFKRELPADHWQVFARTLHRQVPTPRFRAAERNRGRIAKLRPISLGLPLAMAQSLDRSPPPDCEKTIDVFFAGRIRNSSTVRQRGLEELLALREEGYAIDVAESGLGTDEYLARCARAHLVWSPEGFGWQCFRTYEAAICGSAALCSRQSIERYRPLIDGVHAIYYDVEPGELTRTVRAALADRNRLGAIGAAARKHVLAFHTPSAIARHVVEAATAVAGRRAACSTGAG